MSAFVIKLENISKFYGHKLIFKNIDLSLKAATLSLILGDNGAGKSTLLKIMAGLSNPAGGRLIRNNACFTGYLAHSTFLYQDLSALENLRFWAKAYGLDAKASRLMAYLDRVGLNDFAHEKPRIFSRGMAQRLNFARILMLEPQLVLLDEPFTGLDETSRSMMWKELNQARENGTAIVMVSHAADTDAPESDHIYVLANKTLFFSGTSPEYKAFLESTSC